VVEGYDRRCPTEAGRESCRLPFGGRKSAHLAVPYALITVIPLLSAWYAVVAVGQLGVSQFSVSLVVMLSLCLAALGYHLVHAVLKRLHLLAREAERVAAGDRDRRLTESDDESIADLARCFNRITGELQETVNELQRSRNQLRKSLYHVGQAMRSSQDIDNILELILDVAIEMLDAEMGSLMLLEPGGEELTIRVARGLEERVLRTARIKLGEGVSGWVAKQGVPLLVPDIDADPRFPKRRTDRYTTDSLISVPLVARGKSIGVINVNNKTSGDIFSREDLEVLSTVASNAAVAIENAVLQESLETTYFEIVQSLASAVEAKDPYTRGHSDRVTEYALMIGKRMGFSPSELATLEHAAALHDVGKIGIPDSILLKPDKLTDEEYSLVKKHPALGEQIISPIRSLSEVSRFIRHHHEHYDGMGYPDGLAGDEIPAVSRILAVCDAYDAMTTNRPYRPKFEPSEAREMIRQGMGTQFDPQAAAVFLELLDRRESDAGGEDWRRRLRAEDVDEETRLELGGQGASDDDVEAAEEKSA